MCCVVTHVDLLVVSTDNTKEDGYYIVKFTYNSYNLQEEVVIDLRIIAIGEQLANACYISNFRQG